MKGYEKYTRQFFEAKGVEMDWRHKTYIDKAPIWCSVDLRDGNQSLIVPMSLEEKLEFFTFLVKVGFKEIEVGFPAASETEYDFCRALIERDLIPDDVTIQVLTQSREHIIAKTFEALKGCKSAIVHLYNSTSVSQREQVFRKDKKQIVDLAVFGAELCKKYREQTPGNFKFEYSPESFTGTEPEFALEICNAVIDVWQPSENDKVIINLPVTVSHSMPHVYANQVEYMCKNMKSRENLIVSLHPHNDRGCAVADSEMGLLAGADRIEGTLFGNGERTGNVDVITLAMNMYSHGVDPKLNFSDMPSIVELYERCTRMHVYERSPYAGSLVFAAFSGSHQDAIAKGMKWREEKQLHQWNVPYIPIDPTDINRTYDSDVIRVNSQSGKGGIGYLLEQTYGYNLPAGMREHLSYLCKSISDHEHRELKVSDVLSVFQNNYFDYKNPLTVSDMHFRQHNDGVRAELTFKSADKEAIITTDGNGSLDAVSNALKQFTGTDYKLKVYTEHSVQNHGSNSEAVSYIGIEGANGTLYWGAGIHTDIIKAGSRALLSAYNNMLKEGK